MFIGNKKAKNLLARFSNAENIPHILLVGPSGHGKSTLVREMGEGRPFIEMNCRVIRDNNDLFAVLKKVTNRAILFLDETHALTKGLQEGLYEAMESFTFQRITGRGQDKAMTPFSLPRFTLCAATTKENCLLEPFRNRFITVQIDTYNIEELVQIAQQYISSEEIALFFAKNCRYTPRILKKHCEAFNSMGSSTIKEAEELLYALNIFPQGLTSVEVKILNMLKHATLSLSSIAAKLMLEEGVVEEEHEPYLLKNGFIQRAKAGRSLTESGKDYIGQVDII